MLIINNRSLQGKSNIIHKGFSVRGKVFVRVIVCELFLGFLNSFLFLLRLFMLSPINDFDVRFSQSISNHWYFYSQPKVFLMSESVKLFSFGI